MHTHAQIHANTQTQKSRLSPATSYRAEIGPALRWMRQKWNFPQVNATPTDLWMGIVKLHTRVMDTDNLDHWRSAGHVGKVERKGAERSLWKLFGGSTRAAEGGVHSLDRWDDLKFNDIIMFPSFLPGGRSLQGGLCQSSASVWPADPHLSNQTDSCVLTHRG